MSKDNAERKKIKPVSQFSPQNNESAAIKAKTRCSPSKFDGKYFNFVWFLVCEFRHDSI